MNAKLINEINQVNGKRKSRIIRDEDVEIFNEIFESHKDDPAVKTIRVYPRDAFVPNAYKYRADTSIIFARRDETQGWVIGASTLDAHRKYGAGKRYTINNR